MGRTRALAPSWTASEVLDVPKSRPKRTGRPLSAQPELQLAVVRSSRLNLNCSRAGAETLFTRRGPPGLAAGTPSRGVPRRPPGVPALGGPTRPFACPPSAGRADRYLDTIIFRLYPK